MLGLVTALCALAALFSAGSAVAADGEIHGMVTDHLGEPIAGITVCAQGFAAGECDWSTDADGKYSIGGLAAGFYRVGFHVESNPSLNYVQQWYSGKAYAEEADPVQLAEGESKEINAQMQTGGKIHGTVADQETDLPIQGVEVCARSVGVFHDGEIGYCDRSDAAGEFTVKNLGTGQYRLEFGTERHVNYVEAQLPEPPGFIPMTAGGTIEVEAHLRPGVEIEGTLTESGTGAPIVGFLAPYTVPSVCALNPTTQQRIKCGWVDSAGQYSIPGLPAGTYAVSFALDVVSEGLDLHPDGYVRRYWKEVPAFGEATLLAGTAGAVFDGIDAVLTQGEEVFPNCEVQSACPAHLGSGQTSSGATLSGGAVTSITPPQVQSAAHPPVRRLRCKKGFRRVVKSGHARCVKVSKRHRHR
jgi:Carboxypeptidase regulatory-like domain